MADSVRRQIATHLAAAFEALTTANGSKVNVTLVERYLQQPAEHPADLEGWRVGFYLGRETRQDTNPGQILWSLEGEAQAATSVNIQETWDAEDLADGVVEQWRQEQAADALDELKHALEGAAGAVSRGGIAINTEITSRYADEGFPAKDASSNGGRDVYCGCVCAFKILYLDQPTRT